MKSHMSQRFYNCPTVVARCRLFHFLCFYSIKNTLFIPKPVLIHIFLLSTGQYFISVYVQYILKIYCRKKKIVADTCLYQLSVMTCSHPYFFTSYYRSVLSKCLLYVFKIYCRKRKIIEDICISALAK